MDTDRFDHLTRSISTLLSRRTLASALGLGALALPSLVGARKKKRKKKKTVTFNDFGCVNVGGFCKNSDQCCSGICQGKKDKKTCQAHDADVCTGQDGCIGDLQPCTTAAGTPSLCVLTTGNAGYCQSNAFCFDCTRDADCVPFCGTGAACIVCAECLEEGPQTACASTDLDGCQPPP